MQQTLSKKWYILAGFTGFIMTYLTGFLGLMPLEQSILFEAAGRINRGEVPFSDFSFPYGLVPAFMQAFFFKLLGISWVVYIAHAAIINGIFAILLLSCLQMLLSQCKASSLLKGTLLAGWAFYPMIGTPFLENHSLFFAVAAWWSCLAAFKRKKHYLLLFVFPLMVLGFYSKPIPVAFWIFPVLLECWFNRNQWKQWLKWIGWGICLAMFLLVLPALLFPGNNFFYYSFLLPFKLGQERIIGNLPQDTFKIIRQLKVFLICIVPFIFFCWYKIYRIPASKKIFLRFLLLIIITTGSGMLTGNDFYNVTSPVLITSFFVFDVLLKQYGKTIKLYRLIQQFLWIGLIIGISILNFTRKSNDMLFELKDTKQYSHHLNLFLKTPHDNYTNENIGRLKNYIAKGRTVYVGDMLFLYSLTGQKNPWPITHIHDGTSYNSLDTSRYKLLKKDLLQNISDMKADLLIRDSTWWPNENIAYFMDGFRGKKIDSFGIINVYKIDTAAFYAVARSLNINLDK